MSGLPAAVEPVDDVERIAVLRANSLGDLMFALPALDALRATYPRAEITLLARDWHRDFLTTRPGPVDRVIPLPVARGLREEPGAEEDPAELDRFFDAMRRERFDVAVQLHGGGRHSNPFLLRLGARLTVGLRAADAPPLDRWVPYVYFHHEVLRYLEVVSLLGAPPRALDPRVTVTGEDIEESLRAVPDDRRALVALHPGAVDPRRRWPAAAFARVGDALAASGARVVVTGSTEERDVVTSVLDGMAHQAEGLCGRLSLAGLTGLLSRCRLVISNDTGPLHLAAATGAPAVGIYWCGNFVNGGPVANARRRSAVSWRVTCPECGMESVADRCPHTSSFVADVPVEEVADLAFSLLGVRAPPVVRAPPAVRSGSGR